MSLLRKVEKGTMSRQQLKEKGFTIIEVVLVLAIAALIFLMVFIALPALQSSQRDTARKNDVSIVSAAVNSWTGNNRGVDLASISADDIQEYAVDLSDNTIAENINVNKETPTEVTPDDGEIIVLTSRSCGSVEPNGKVKLGAGTIRQYVTVTRLEGGNNSGYCLES